jgi:poly-beta-1,6-N-acetyl-D-glucosamine synthase
MENQGASVNMGIHWLQWLGFWLVMYPAMLCLYIVVSAAWHVLRRESRHMPRASNNQVPSIAVLVPARNEEAVLGDCLDALLLSDHPGMQIWVLSDGSTDRTASIARDFASRGVRLIEFAENVGKSRALQTALEQIDTDLVMVVDADTRLETHTVTEMALAFHQPAIVGATANIRVQRAHSLLAALQSVEYASIIGLLKRANSAWGGLFTVSGAASAFRVSALRAAGGFASPSITEDIELSWRLQRAGGTLVYVPRAHAHVQVPGSLPALWRQRMRWSQGLIEVLRLHGFHWGEGKPALAIFATEALLSIIWVVLLASVIVLDAAAWCWHPHAFGLPRPGLLHTLPIVLFLCQTITASVFDGHYGRLSWWTLPLAIFYPLYFAIVVLPAGLIGWARGLTSRDAARWERTERKEKPGPLGRA